MPMILVILLTTVLVGCGTYKGNEMWRRSICNEIADVDEQARCLEDATRPESDYERDVEEATGG